MKLGSAAQRPGSTLAKSRAIPGCRGRTVCISQVDLAEQKKLSNPGTIQKVEVSPRG